MSKVRQRIFSVTVDDCIVETFTVGGHGGSGKDTSNTGVRIRHEPSGAVAECREERSQLTNKRRAFRRMGQSAKFQAWARLQVAKLSGRKSVEQQVEDALQPEHLRVEVHTGQGWEPYRE